jgi:large subunit ribosomal protein L28
MAKRCAICDRGTVHGHRISHAHNVTNRTFEANLKRVRALVDGAVRRLWVCTRCLRSGKVQKPPIRKWSPEEAMTPNP